MLEENHLTVIDENGQEILCEILFTFDSEEYGKDYVVYSPLAAEFEDEDGLRDVHVSSYMPAEDGEGGSLEPIEDEQEWAMVEEVVNTFLEDEDEMEVDDEEGE